MAGSTNFDTFLGGNGPADPKELGQNLRGVFNDSDALVNSQTSIIPKRNFLDGPGGGQTKGKVISPVVNVKPEGGQTKGKVISPVVNVKPMKYVIKVTPELAEIDEEDGSSSSA